MGKSSKYLAPIHKKHIEEQKMRKSSSASREDESQDDSHKENHAIGSSSSHPHKRSDEGNAASGETFISPSSKKPISPFRKSSKTQLSTPKRPSKKSDRQRTIAPRTAIPTGPMDTKKVNQHLFTVDTPRARNAGFLIFTV